MKKILKILLGLPVISSVGATVSCTNPYEVVITQKSNSESEISNLDEVYNELKNTVINGSELTAGVSSVADAIKLIQQKVGGDFLVEVGLGDNLNRKLNNYADKVNVNISDVTDLGISSNLSITIDKIKTNIVSNDVKPAPTIVTTPLVEPAPVEPAPVEPAPVEPAPVEPAPVGIIASEGQDQSWIDANTIITTENGVKIFKLDIVKLINNDINNNVDVYHPTNGEPVDPHYIDGQSTARMDQVDALVYDEKGDVINLDAMRGIIVIDGVSYFPFFPESVTNITLLTYFRELVFADLKNYVDINWASSQKVNDVVHAMPDSMNSDIWNSAPIKLDFVDKNDPANTYQTTFVFKNLFIHT